MTRLTQKEKWLWAIKHTRKQYYMRKRREVLETLLCDTANDDCERCIMRAFAKEYVIHSTASKKKYCLNRLCLPYSNTVDLPPSEEEEQKILEFFKLLGRAIQDFHGNDFNSLNNKLMMARIVHMDTIAFK